MTCICSLPSQENAVFAVQMAAELQLHIAQGGEVPGLPILVSLAQGQAAAAAAAAAATKK